MILNQEINILVCKEGGGESILSEYLEERKVAGLILRLP